MKGYCFNKETREFTGIMDLQHDPLESKKAGKDIYLLAANTTTKEPPTFTEKQVCKFIDDEWVVEDLPEPEPEKEPEQPTENELLIIEEEKMIQDEIRKIAIERLGSKLKKVKE